MAGPVVYDYKMMFHNVGGHRVAFEIANEDNTDTTPQYFGYVSSFGLWIIQRMAVIGSTRQYTYCAGKTRTDYDTHWTVATGRFVVGSLTFDTFDTLGDDL